jgi:phosphate transport system ATP-binding protein
MVLSDINVTIYKQQITGLVGPSGCGKTSFLSILNRLCDDIPGTKVTGTLTLENENLFDKKINKILLRKKIGMLFQKPHPFPFSILKNLTLPLVEHGIYHKAEQEKLIFDALNSVGLCAEVKDRLHQSALTLSGGQQQRLCLARTLILKPEIILMDEPCSALDPQATKVIEDLIIHLKQFYTVIIVTHNLAQAKRIADQTVVFWNDTGVGRLIEFGSTQQIFTRPKNTITAAYISGTQG